MKREFGSNYMNYKEEIIFFFCNNAANKYDMDAINGN